jgi:hypothetical protein
MGLLKRGSKPERDDKPQQPRPAKSSKKRGVLGAIGVETEAVKTADRAQAEKNRHNAQRVWKYLRDTALDKALAHYYETGDFSALEEVAEGPALAALKAQHSKIREQGFATYQPDRGETDAEVRVVGDPVTDAQGHVTQFTVQETFNDYAIDAARDSSGALEPVSQADGSRARVRVIVNVYANGSQFKIYQVIDLASNGQ